ncbi:MAG: Fur family transcriptional regulator [Burkholderiaceae bacterium]
MKTEKAPLAFSDAMIAAEQRLRQHGHRVTRPRQLILATLLAADCASSQDELSRTLEKSNYEVDRVTVYRVLEWLVEHKLAHRVSSDSRAWQFNALNDEEHEHGHFACRECERIFCLADREINVAPKMPAGFRADESELLVRGRCPDCGKQ